MILLSTQLGMLGRVSAVDPDPHGSASVWAGSALESGEPDLHPHQRRMWIRIRIAVVGIDQHTEEL
jgi:hypothetical protein